MSHRFTGAGVRYLTIPSYQSLVGFLERYQAAFLAEMTRFVAAVTDGTSPNPGIFDGLQAQILADAATTSLATGQPVDLPG